MTGRRNRDGDFQVIAARGIVADEMGRVLLVAEKNLKWHLPGGWIETMEDPMICCEREVYEETGMRVSASRIIYISEHLQMPMGQYTEHVQKFDLYCLCALAEGQAIDPDWKDHDNHLVEHRRFVDSEEWQSGAGIYAPPALRALSVVELCKMPSCYHKVNKIV